MMEKLLLRDADGKCDGGVCAAVTVGDTSDSVGRMHIYGVKKNR
jgi:hypothetical protein